MEELMLDRGQEKMGFEVLRGRDGMMSRPEAELRMRKARDLSHCSGIMNNKDKAEDGE